MSVEAVVEKNLFLRAAALARGKISEASQKKIAMLCNYEEIADVDQAAFRRYATALSMLQVVHLRRDKDPLGLRLGNISKSFTAMIVAEERLGDEGVVATDYKAVAEEVVRHLGFISYFVPTKNKNTLAAYSIEESAKALSLM